MSGNSSHLRGRRILAVLIAIVGLCAASAIATQAAFSAAKPFELVLNGEYDRWEGGLTGAFTSEAPFCEAGSVVDVDLGVRRFACADGSGSITLDFRYSQYDEGYGGNGEWTIVESTGQYGGLRGRGIFGEASLAPGKFQTTFHGVVDADASAPTIRLVSANTSKVTGKKSLFKVPVVLDIRDNIEDNSVAYKVVVMRASGVGPWLAWKSGQAIGNVSCELRVRRPNAGVRAMLIRTTAVDPVGNESTLDVRVRLPK